MIVSNASEQDVEFIAGHESPGGRAVTRAYLCPAGVVTIGDGFTMGSKVFAVYWKAKHGRPLRLGDTIGQEESRMLLRRLIDEEYGAAVAAKIKPRTQHHFGGGSSTAFNCGKSALGWRWAKALAAGKVSEAAALLRVTAVTANGRKLNGLVRRRADEAALIEFGIYRMGGHAVSTTKDDVVWYQQQLVTLGFEIKVDGIPGRQTDAAVRKFQGDHGLKVDGIVGPATRATMIRAVDAKRGTAATTGAGGAGAAGGGAEAVAVDAAATDALLQVLIIGVLAALAVFGAVWLFRNRGRLTGRRVPT